MLPKNRKLSRREIKLVYSKGSRTHSNYFTLKSLPNNLNTSRFSVVVSIKVCPKAHDRNNLKRQICQTVSPYSRSLDIIITVHPQVVNLTHAEISTHLNQVLSKIPLF